MGKRQAQNILLIPLGLSVLLASLGTSMANLALPAVASDFGVSFSAVRWTVLVYLISTTILSLAVGLLGDRKGKLEILLLGTIVFAAGAVMAGFSSAFWVLIAARALQGTGGAALLVLPVAIAADQISDTKTGRAIGLFSTMSAIGTASGPSIGGLLLGLNGWRSLFLLMAAMASLNILFLVTFARRNPASVSLAKSRTSFLNAAKVVYFDLSLRIHLMSNVGVSAVMMSTLIVGPFFLAKDLGLEPVTMGLVMSTGPITSAIAGVLTGQFVDRYGSSRILRLSFAQLFLGASAFMFLPSKFGIAGFVSSAIFLSTGYQLFLSANSNLIMKSANSESRGLVSGALSLSRNIGLMIGTFVMGIIFDGFGFRATFFAAGILIFVLILANLRIQKRERP